MKWGWRCLPNRRQRSTRLTATACPIITGSPGTGKTTVLKTILEVYRRLHPKGEIVLMAPTGRASRRMAESTGFDRARTLHSGLGLGSEEDDANRNRKQEPLSADLIIVDEFFYGGYVAG